MQLTLKKIVGLAVDQASNQAWIDLFDQHRIDRAVLDPAVDRDLVEALSRHSDWSVEFADQDVVLVCRAPAGAQAPRHSATSHRHRSSSGRRRG